MLETASRSSTRHSPSVILPLCAVSGRRFGEIVNCSTCTRRRAECAEVSRSDMKRATARARAIRDSAARAATAQRRLLGVRDLARRAGAPGRRFPVWYLEDDVYLPGSWSAFMQRYDAAGSAAFFEDDLLAPQIPYRLADQHQRRWDGVAEVERGWKRDRSRARRRTTLRSCSDGPEPRRRSSRSRYPPSPRSCRCVASGYPARPTTPGSHQPSRARAGDRRDALRPPCRCTPGACAGASPPRWRAPPIPAAKAHEEFFVPTVCRAVLHDPPCRWATFAADDMAPCRAARMCRTSTRANRRRAPRASRTTSPISRRSQLGLLRSVLGGLAACAAQTAAALQQLQGHSLGARSARRGQCDRVALRLVLSGQITI